VNLVILWRFSTLIVCGVVRDFIQKTAFLMDGLCSFYTLDVFLYWKLVLESCSVKKILGLKATIPLGRFA